MPEGFRIATAFVQVSPDLEDFRARLQAALDEATAGVTARARVTLDTDGVRAGSDEVRSQLDELAARQAAPRVTLDASDLRDEADDARARLDELDGQTADARADLDTTDLTARADDAQHRLDELDSQRPEARLRLDTADFDARLDEAEARLDRFRGESATATLDSGVRRDAQGRLRDSRGRFVAGGGRGGGGFLGGLFGGSSNSNGDGFLSGVGSFLGDHGMIAGITAGVTALLPSVGGAAMGLGLLGGAGALALGPIGQALTAAHQASQTQGPSAAQQAATNFSNQVAVAQAREQVANAEQQAARNQVAALQQVRQAEQSVEEANYGLSQAQYNLNQAWEQAREQIAQLNDQLADSKLNVQQAQLAIQQAIQNQQQVDENAYSTDLDRQQAALAVAQAQQQLKDSQDQATAAQYAANQANKAGVDGSQQVIQAKQALVQAQYQQTDAQQSLANAESQVAYQRQQDAQNIADAQRNLTDTIKEQQLQAAATAATENQAANQFQRDMAGLTPAARKVVDQILGMRTVFHDLQKAAENAVAPGLSIFLDGIAKSAPQITTAVSKMGNVLGNAFSGIGKALQSKGGQNVLGGLISNGVHLMQVVVPAVEHLVGALAKLGARKGAVDGLAGAIAGIAGGVANVATALTPFTGPLGQVFTTLGKALEPVGTLLGTVVGALAKALAPILAALLPGVKTLADALGKGLSAALAAIGPLLTPVAEMISALVVALAPVLPILGKVIGQVAQALTPAMQALVPVVQQSAQILSGELQTSLVQIAQAVLPVVPLLARMTTEMMPLITMALNVTAVLTDLGERMAGPLIAAMGTVLTTVVGLVTNWRGAWQLLEQESLKLWHEVLDPMWQGIEQGATWLYQNGILPLWHGIDDAFHWIESSADWLWHNVFDPLWHGIEQGASDFVSVLKTTWHGLEDAFSDPVKFMVNTVYDKGIAKLWNEVVGHIGLKSIELKTFQFAGGGVLPGYAPGDDTVPAMLSPGEGVLVPEAVRAIGPAAVHSLNAAYGGGRTSSGGHYAGGGIIGSIRGGVSDAVHGVESGFGKAAGIAKIVAALATGNGGALTNALNQLVSTNAVGDYARMMVGVPKTLISEAVKKVVGMVSGGSGGGVSVPGAVSGSIAEWFARAVKLTGVGTAWIPDLETIAHYESGDNPNAINNWDSNAKAGDPSRGIMQTIMSTFLAYHQAGTSNNIYDPVANIAAAINYIRSRYGTVANVPGIKSLATGGPYVGYDSGGWLMPGSMPVNGLSRPEAVLTPDQSQWLHAMAETGAAQRAAGTDPSKQVTIQFFGTQYPNVEQMAAIKRDMALALGGA